MTNLRVVKLSIKNSTTIEISFTSTLDTNLGIENVYIVAAAGGIENPTILAVSPSSNILTIIIRPLIPRANYKLTLTSTDTQPFKGARGEVLVEDESNNVIFFIGQQEDNIVRDQILDDLPSIYDSEAGTLVFDSIDVGAKQISEAAYSANKVRSSNYVSITVEDEEITRGSGPFDKLLHEGAYQLLRVGNTITNALEEGSFTFSSFPSDTLSLKQLFIDTEIVSNSSNDSNGFSGLIINLTNKPIIKVTSIVLIRDFIRYIYDITQYKYGVKESKYDSNNAYSYDSLENNQIKLNENAIGTFPFPQGSDTFEISYYYKKEGRDVDPDSISIITSISVIRESAPAVSTSFILSHAPIINNNGKVYTINGIEWLDPAQNFDSTKKHPAFQTEISFNSSSFPNQVGEFSVNYETGQVLVYGANGTGTDGTTVTPPVANYTYEKTYQNNLDYIFYSDLDEIASIPNRDLRGNPAIVLFNYEDGLANGSDFNFLSNIEVINERVENRLIEDVGLTTKYYPVNEVFRIYNETTGELYTPTNIYRNEVYFNANQPPRTSDVKRELVNFASEIESQLVITTISTFGSLNIFTINLSNTDIVSATGGFIGANFNSSLSFSEEIFAREFYYSPDKTLMENLQRLKIIGDYIVDYESGIIYLAVVSGQSTAIGTATYKYNDIQTKNPHIIRVDNVYRSASSISENTDTLTVGTVYDTVVNIPDLGHVGETTVNNVEILINDNVAIVSSDVFRLNHIYQVTDLQTKPNPIDFSEGATVSTSQKNHINLSSSGATITDDNLFVYYGPRNYIEAERIMDLINLGLIELMSAISVYKIGESLNYFTQGSDGYVDAVTGRIYLPSGINISGEYVEAKYKARLRNNATVLVDYISGDMFIDYTYSKDELLVSYEYGNNVLDWSISSSLKEGDIYYVSYKYGALRESLRDNFGVLTSLPELAAIPDNLDRETYRNAISGSLQSFIKGPTIPSIKKLAESFTQIDPNITESVFEEWILGRDYLNLLDMEATENIQYLKGKFANGLYLCEDNQTASIPASSNIRFNEGTWEAFVVPDWDGIENDATLTFNLLLDSSLININQVYIGSGAINPTSVPFSINKNDSSVLGRPYNLHNYGVSGYFIWFDTTSNRWSVRVRAPIIEERLFSGRVSTSGEFYDVKVASTADGYSGYEGFEIDEINDKLWSTNQSIRFSFIVDSYDMMNMAFDAYDSYDSLGTIAGFDGIDFISDNLHYFFDTATEKNKCRMSLYKDGSGFLKFRVYDNNKRLKVLSHNIHNWLAGETHHLAVSWKINTTEQRDELHLFVDGQEAVNTYRFKGYLDVPFGSKFLDEASETLLLSATLQTIGGFDLQTFAGSNSVISYGANFSGITIGSRFEILDNTLDGISTQNTPYVYVSNIIGQNILELEIGPVGSTIPWVANYTLENVKYSVNPLHLQTVSYPNVEKVRVFVKNSIETELNSPNTLTPDYGIEIDDYADFINVYNGIDIGDTILLKTYGLEIGRCVQNAYVWTDLKTNMLNTIMPAPISVSKIDIYNKLLPRTMVEPGTFVLISTIVGGHLVSLLSSSLNTSQVSNTETGRRIKVIVFGDNIDWFALNNVILIGSTTDGYGTEILTFTAPGEKISTRYFTSLTNAVASFTPIDDTKIAGSIEIIEAYPLNWAENNGLWAEIHLSVQEQNGINGNITNLNILTDAYSRFGAEDIGKSIIFPSIADAYSIIDVPLDPSGTAKDSNSVILSPSFINNLSGLDWKMINTFYGDSGFANALITFEIARTGGQPFLLRNSWHEINLPVYLIIPWNENPEQLYIGSDFEGHNQACSSIDELRILDEISTDTSVGEVLPSSGRSITTDSLSVREFEATNQTLALFHFDNNLDNSANFITSFSGSYKQCENSVNSKFGQSAVFNTKKALKVDNKSIFRNNEGTIEFWVSPILDTYNDPTLRYYIDITSEVSTTGQVITLLTVKLPVRARRINSVKIFGSNINYFNGGSLMSDGLTIRLGQPVPTNVLEVDVNYVPITSQGDRFSIFKNTVGELILSVIASEIDYQINVPIYWKKNTWHRVFVGWDLNNDDNQDRIIMMVDGAESGITLYGTGFLYGTGMLYGQRTIWSSAIAGTTISRNILSDINMLDTFNTINIGADFTEQFTALARMDNIRFSSQLRPITYLGATQPDTIVGEGPGRLIGQDFLYTSNTNVAKPVISDALTRLLLDFDTTPTEVEYIAKIRDAATGIFDFYVEVIDTFELADTDLVHELITNLIKRIKPSHTRSFVSFIR